MVLLLRTGDNASYELKLREQRPQHIVRMENMNNNNNVFEQTLLHVTDDAKRIYKVVRVDRIEDGQDDDELVTTKILKYLTSNDALISIEEKEFGYDFRIVKKVLRRTIYYEEVFSYLNVPFGDATLVEI